MAFTDPYVVIEGVFAVPRDSALTTVADVDREGVRIGVKRGSAYDLYLSRTLAHASVMRGEEVAEALSRSNQSVWLAVYRLRPNRASNLLRLPLVPDVGTACA